MESTQAFYTIKDSLGNLRIRVSLERVQAASGGTAPSLSAFLRHRNSLAGVGEHEQWPQSGLEQRPEGDRETEEYTFKWQEKVFSQREFLTYGVEAYCETVLQRQYHQDIVRLRQEGGRPTTRLFSYTEGDDVVAFEDGIKCMTIGSGKPSFLVEKMAAVRHRRVAPRPQGRAIYQDPVIDIPTSEAIRKSHTLPQCKQTFRIMADLGPRDTAAPDPQDEHVFCVIRVFNDNLMSVEPDFNHQTKPAYKIKSRLGDFQYVIEHASSSLTLEDLEMQRKAEASLYDYRVSVQKTQAMDDFDVPEEGVLKVLYLGEIISAKDFEYDQLFIHYFIELPRGWYSSSGTNCLSGTTPTCKTADIDKNDVAYFSCPFELELCCNVKYYELESNHFTKWPQIFLEILSRDNWKRYRTEGYAYLTMPTAPGPSEYNLKTWRPLSGGTQSELRRWFIGGLEELDELDYTRYPKNFEGKNLSKFGFSTKSTGSVDIRFYTAFQSRQFISTERQQQLRYGALLEKIGASVGMHSSIIAVLEAFQRARQRMISVRDNIYAEQGLFPA